LTEQHVGQTADGRDSSTVARLLNIAVAAAAALRVNGERHPPASSSHLTIVFCYESVRITELIWRLWSSKRCVHVGGSERRFLGHLPRSVATVPPDSRAVRCSDSYVTT